MASRRWAIYLGCGALLLLSCGGCCVWAVIQGQLNQRELGPLAAACSAQPVAGAGAYPVASPRGIVMRRTSDGWHTDLVAMPAAFEADTRSDTNIVVCLEPDVEITDEPCSFSDVMFRVHTFSRSHYAAHARVVAAASGATLFEGDMSSAIPACTYTSTGLVPSDGYVYEGDEIGRTEIEAWLRGWLATRPPI